MSANPSTCEVEIPEQTHKALFLAVAELTVQRGYLARKYHSAPTGEVATIPTWRSIVTLAIVTCRVPNLNFDHQVPTELAHVDPWSFTNSSGNLPCVPASVLADRFARATGR